MTISMDKKYRTRDGRDVRLLCVDGPSEKPIVGFVGKSIYSWFDNGLDDMAFHLPHGDGYHPLDLIAYHEPDIRTIWVNVYEKCNIAWDKEKDAINSAQDNAIAIAQPVTFEVKRT